MWLEILLVVAGYYWYKNKKRGPDTNTVITFGSNPIMDSERLEMFVFDSTDPDQLNHYNWCIGTLIKKPEWQDLVSHEYERAFGQPCSTVAVFELNQSMFKPQDRIGFDSLGTMLYYNKNVKLAFDW